MTLRFPFYSQQLLSAVTCSLLLLAGTMKAQDVFLGADGKALVGPDGRPLQGRVMGATPAGVQVMIGASSSITLPLAQIKEVRMAVIPPEFAQAQKAFEAKQFDQALAFLKILDRYKGLPAEWAQQALAMVGDIYIEKGEIPKAEASFAEFQKLYPTGAQAELGLAKLAVAKKDFATAKSKLEPVLAKADADKSVSRSNGAAYGQAYLLMGQVKESEGEAATALEDYLKTVTIYYYDRSAVAQAQEKADALRKANPSVFIP